MQALIDTHKLAIALHNSLGDDPDSDQDCLARCETILNITSAEIERVHSDRNEDLCRLSMELLDAQIEYHERVRY